MPQFSFSPLPPIPVKGRWLMIITSLLIVVLLAGLANAQLEEVKDYDYAKHNFSTYEINIYKYFKIKDYALRDHNFTYQTKQGGSYTIRELVSNITITNKMFFNDSYIVFKHVSHSQDGVSMYTRLYFLNSTGDNQILSTGSASSSLSCTFNSVPVTLGYDKNYATGFFNRNGNAYDISACTSAIKYQSEIWDSSIFYDVGTNGHYEVIFLVLDEFGRPVEDATITPTRLFDNHTYESVKTDVVGKARFDLNDGYEYNISVGKTGYNNFSGLLTVYETAYTLTLSQKDSDIIGYYGLDRNVSLITTPVANPNPTVTNFTLSATDLLSRLVFVGVNVSINGTNYSSKDYSNSYSPTFNASSLHTTLTINLTNYSGQTAYTNYFYILYNGTANKTYSLPVSWLIININQSDSSAAGFFQEYSGLSDFAKTFIITIVAVIMIIVLSLLGIPPNWSSSVVIPLFMVAIAFGWLDPIVGGLVTLVLIGLTVVASRSGAGI